MLISKASGMAFCVSKDNKPLGGSLMYQVLTMNTAHPQGRLEFQLSEGTVDRYGRFDVLRKTVFFTVPPISSIDPFV